MCLTAPASPSLHQMSGAMDWGRLPRPADMRMEMEAQWYMRQRERWILVRGYKRLSEGGEFE